MLVRCVDCERAYDDAESSTICPHDPLGGGDYCRRHDLFFCPICKAEAEKKSRENDQLT